MSYKQLFQSACIPRFQQEMVIPYQINHENEIYLRTSDLIERGSYSHYIELFDVRNRELLAARPYRRPEACWTDYEITYIDQIRHPNLNRFYCHFVVAGIGYHCMKLWSRATVAIMLREGYYFNDLEIRVYLRQILSAVKYLNDKLIIHKDLRPSNILINNYYDLKIADFTYANRLERKNQRIKSPASEKMFPFLPPEYNFKETIGLEVDVWSVGYILYCMLVGNEPFEGRTVEEACRRMQREPPEFPLHVNSDASRICRVMLKPFWFMRPNAKELLQMDFFRRIYPRMHITVVDTLTLDDEKDDSNRIPYMIVNQPCANYRKYYDLVTKLYDTICNFLDDNITINEKEALPRATVNLNWAQAEGCTNKCLTYLLRDGSVGAHFADGTKMLFSHHEKLFYYWDQREAMERDKDENICRGLLLKLATVKIAKGAYDRQNYEYLKIEYDRSYLYLKMKTSKAIIFLFSNQVAQAYFIDDSYLIISIATNEYVHVTDKKTYVYTIKPVDATGISNAALKKLIYIKDKIDYIRKWLLRNAEGIERIRDFRAIPPDST